MLGKVQAMPLSRYWSIGMGNLNYLSICSGIESATVAWEPLGWKAIGFSEIDLFRNAVLKHHYPKVKNYGDFTKIESIGTEPDVLVGGTPCATFSIAGLRKGFDEYRGNLALEFLRLVKRVRPTWVVWENVPGVLSSNGGSDFGSFIGGLGECGYRTAYRILDTQHIRTQRFPRALPQMRRRVFVVGYRGDWKRPAAVLFDDWAMQGNPAPIRRQRKETSIKATFRIVRSDQYTESDVAGTVAARDYKSATDLLLDSKGMRRLTPIETERLQGLPDNYTQVPFNGKPKESCPVARRIEACGRSMSINVMEFLGNRIDKVHHNEI